MASPIFAITLQRKTKPAKPKTLLYLRRSEKVIAGKRADFVFDYGTDVNNVEGVIDSYADWFPKAQRYEWVVMQFTSKPNGFWQAVQMRRTNQRDHPRMTFAEAYPLFLAYMRMYMTQEKQ